MTQITVEPMVIKRGRPRNNDPSELGKMVIRVKRRMRNEYRKQNGLCVLCGKRPGVDGKVLCAECAAKNLEVQRRRRDKLMEAGICVTCGKRPARPKAQYCDECARRKAMQTNFYKMTRGMTEQDGTVREVQ